MEGRRTGKRMVCQKIMKNRNAREHINFRMIPKETEQTTIQQQQNTHPSVDHLVECDAPAPPIRRVVLLLALEALRCPVPGCATKTPSTFVRELQNEAKIRETNMTYQGTEREKKNIQNNPSDKKSGSFIRAFQQDQEFQMNFWWQVWSCKALYHAAARAQIQRGFRIWF